MFSVQYNLQVHKGLRDQSRMLTSCIQTSFFFLCNERSEYPPHVQLIWLNETCSDSWSCVLNFTHSISSRSPQTWGSVAQTAILERQPLHQWLQASLHWHWKQSKIWVILWKIIIILIINMQSDLLHSHGTHIQGSQSALETPMW